MKFNKWTIGLAAVGAVSLASAARADEMKMSQVQTALSSTTLSGYVDVGLQYGNATGPNYGAPEAAALNAVSLNVVDIALDKPLDATPFSSGYHIELWAGAGTAAPGLTTGSLIRQAYLALGTTVAGQEIDWKIGVWDTIIGYEGLTSSVNPNYTHSYGFALEPTTHTGVLGSYKVNDNVTVQAGVADNNAFNTGTINGTVANPLFSPSILALVSLTAPDSFGPLKGATLSVGGINTPAAGGANLYAGVTIPTPNTALKFGSAFDYVESGGAGHDWDIAVYGTYQANDKLSLNLRGEYLNQNGFSAAGVASHDVEELTATVQYAIWANVLSRVELRWDHGDSKAFANVSNGGALKNAILVAAQLIYTF